MLRKALPHHHQPLPDSLARAFFAKHATHSMILAVLALAGLLIGLDSTIMNGALLSLPGQLGTERSTLQWIDRAKEITGWTSATSQTIGLRPLAGSLLLVVWIRRSF
jgi:hypothetical protein